MFMLSKSRDSDVSSNMLENVLVKETIKTYKQWNTRGVRHRQQLYLNVGPAKVSNLLSMNE